MKPKKKKLIHIGHWLGHHRHSTREDPKANKFWTEKAINSEKSMEGERERESEKH